MPLTVILTEGPWRLLASPDTDPAWVGWVHDAAPVWLAEAIRLRDAGRAAGVETTPTPDRWAMQMEWTRNLVAAIGQIGAGTNTPNASFGPWAEEVVGDALTSGTLIPAADVGPDPWPGWGYTSPGEWRRDAFEVVAINDQHVREAVVGEGGTPAQVRVALATPGYLAPVVFDTLAWRVWLGLNGATDARYLNTPAPDQIGEAGDTGGGHTADAHSNDCNGRTAWACIDWAVWWPGFGQAGDVAFNAIVPLKWLWDLACRVVDRLEALGSVAEIVAASRLYQNRRNRRALDYLGSLTPPIIAEVPEDIIAVVARDQAARLQVPQSAVVTRQLGTTIGGAIGGPVGLAIVIGSAVPEILYQAFGQAQGRWVNPWNEREPAVALASLSGSIDLRHPQTPIVSVLTPPGGLPAPGSSVSDLHARHHAARVGATRVALPPGQTRQEQLQVNRERIATEETRRLADARPRKKKSGAGLALVGLALALVVK